VKLFCIGLNHHTADIETRERFAGHAQTVGMLQDLDCHELLLLATCNRVEIYAAAEHEIASERIANCLRVGGEVASAPDLASFYRHENAECARHLFRVTSGMDSMVIGETEILGQTKRAYENARINRQTGRFLHRLCQHAFSVAKQVRTKTEIGRGSVSVGSVAVDLAEKIFADLRGRKVLVLGAGETSEKTLRALNARGVSDLRVSNRSSQRAAELAAELDGIAIPFGTWLEQCREIDILISSTSADAQLLTPALLAPMLEERVDRPLFIVDIAVPRDIAPEINEMDGVYLYDIDSLQSIAEETLQMRRHQFAAAEAIIDEHVGEFCRQLGTSMDSKGMSTNYADQAGAAPRLEVSSAS
jgi:glutamyl-tRNA reductase